MGVAGVPLALRRQRRWQVVERPGWISI